MEKNKINEVWREPPALPLAQSIENNQNQVVLSVESVVIRLRRRHEWFLFGIQDFSSTPSDSACEELDDGITPDKVEE